LRLVSAYFNRGSGPFSVSVWAAGRACCKRLSSMVLRLIFSLSSKMV